MGFLDSVFGTSGFMPHGYCFTWRPAILWSMVAADGVIALAYFSIPAAILSFARKRDDPSINGVAALFSAFILACGATHVMDIWTIWQADYGAQALTKSATAVVSLVTAVALWYLMPKALKVPSARQLQNVIASLQEEVERRRAAEEQVVDVQQSLAVALAASGAGFISTDREGRVTRFNAVAEQLLGWPEVETRGQLLWAVFVREDRPAAYASMNPVDVVIGLDIGVETVTRATLVSRDGKRVSVDIQADITRASDGSVLGLAIVFRDVTRLIVAEAESSRLAAIVESSHDAIIGKTLDGRITSWNGAATAMFGYAPHEAIGRSIQILIPPDRSAEEMRILADLAQGRQLRAFDTVRRTKDGSLISVSITISPIRDAQGRIVGASKIARDVSEQRRAEAALRDSEARLRFTLESAKIGDWMIDLPTGRVDRSLRHDQCFGFPVLQPEWSVQKSIDLVHPDDRAYVTHALHLAAIGQQQLRFECRVTWPDASLHWISVRGDVLRQGSDRDRLVGIVIDVTAQRQADDDRLTAQRLETENRQILEANRLKSQFLANMSHELRTPLNAVIGFADLLHSGAVSPTSPKHHEFLGHIGTSGRHLLQLINDVLDLSKVESGKFEFYPEPVELAAIVREVTDVLHTLILRKRIALTTDLDDSITDVVLDAARLKQVLYNYLSNAIKFTPEGGRVIVRTRPEGAQHFRLEVEDTGMGIAADDIPRLFGEFQQLDAGHSKHHQGTGLGLALTRRLVQAQGGSVGVRSAPGLGSVFHAILNRTHGTDESVTVPLVTDSPATANRVLVIEHSRDNQNLLARALSASGFSVDAASTGEEAVQQARSNTYDAIALNLVMPDETGLGVLATIRQRGASHAAPVTGLIMPADGPAVASFGVADVLSKPIRGDEVLSAVSRIKVSPPRRMRVLVIDDDPLALDLMSALLKNSNMDAIVSLSARDALSDIETHRPDAIVLDLIMPGFNGFDMLEALRELPRWRDTPVFVWTSMLLSDQDYANLQRSASIILSKGGGGVTEMLAAMGRTQGVQHATLQEFS